MKALFKLGNAAHSGLYRLTDGKLAGGGHEDGKVIILTTTGRKTGRARQTPLMHFNDGENVVVVASAGGGDRHPGWYHNLVADSAVTVQIGAERRPVRARVASGDERQDLWRRIVDQQPRFGDYEQKTDREIPVVVLEPR